MDPKVKQTLLTEALPALVVPFFRLAVSNHYEMKMMEKRMDMEVQKAERTANAVNAVSGAQNATGPKVRVGPSADTGQPSVDGESVYEHLEALRDSIDCGFCKSAAESLMDAPPEDAQRGLSELQDYKDVAAQMDDADVTKEEAERVVAELVGDWEVVPKYIY